MIQSDACEFVNKGTMSPGKFVEHLVCFQIHFQRSSLSFVNGVFFFIILRFLALDQRFSFTSSLPHSSSAEDTEGERNSEMATTMLPSWSRVQALETCVSVFITDLEISVVGGDGGCTTAGLRTGVAGQSRTDSPMVDLGCR